jgi:hypothetical protein
MAHLRVSPLTTAAAIGAAALLAGCTGSTPSNKPTAGTTKPTASPSATTPVADLPPQQILAEAMAAARSAGSMHYDEQVTASRASVNAVGSAMLTVGREVAGGSNGALMTEIVLPGSTYLHGNAAALTGFLDLSAKTAARLANRWLVLHAGDRNYQQITDGITGDSLLSSITPVGSLTKAKTLQKVGSQSVIGVVGKAPASSEMPAGSYTELWVAATGSPLPVAVEELAPDGDKMELAFTQSGWGAKVTGVAAPAGALPFPAQ